MSAKDGFPLGFTVDAVRERFEIRQAGGRVHPDESWGDGREELGPEPTPRARRIRMAKDFLEAQLKAQRFMAQLAEDNAEVVAAANGADMNPDLQRTNPVEGEFNTGWVLHSMAVTDVVEPYMRTGSRGQPLGKGYRRVAVVEADMLSRDGVMYLAKATLDESAQQALPSDAAWHQTHQGRVEALRTAFDNGERIELTAMPVTDHLSYLSARESLAVFLIRNELEV